LKVWILTEPGESTDGTVILGVFRSAQSAQKKKDELEIEWKNSNEYKVCMSRYLNHESYELVEEPTSGYEIKEWEVK
jgi:hypothetical protein